MKSKIKRVLAFFMMLCIATTLLPVMEAQAASFSPVWPLSNGHIVNGLDYYSGGSSHNGIDIAPDSSSYRYQDVYAVADGTVVEARNQCTHESMGASHSCPDTWGNYICIKHVVNGVTYYSIYAHLKDNSLTVSYGSTVRAGQKIAQMGSSGGSTGHHLHLEIWQGSRNSRNDGRNARSFDYYMNNSSALSGVKFASGLASTSVAYKTWIKNNCTLSGGYYVYNAVDAFMKVENLAVPSSMGKGNKPYLSGNVTSNCTINWLWVGIRNKNEFTPLSYAETNPLSYTYDLKDLLSKLDFAGLENGNYTLSVEATGGGQYWNLYSADFTVKDAFMEVEDLEMPSSIECGNTPNLRGNARSNCIITWLWVGIRYKDTYTTLSSAETNPLSYTCDLKDLLSKLDFAGLENGEYTLRVEATGGGQYWNIYSSDFVVKDGTTSLRGDVNGDGRITNTDLVMLARIIVGLE